MGDPLTWTIIGTSVGVLSAGVSAVGAVKEGQAQAAQASYQAKVAENNRVLAERAAQDALERGRIAETNQRMATKRLIGRQRAVLAGSGAEVDTGSALDLTSDTAAFGELDALTVRSNAEREALGFRTQGMGFQAEADLARARGAAGISAGYYGAAGSIFGGLESVASKWYDYKKIA